MLSEREASPEPLRGRQQRDTPAGGLPAYRRAGCEAKGGRVIAAGGAHFRGSKAAAKLVFFKASLLDGRAAAGETEDGAAAQPGPGRGANNALI